MTNGAIRRVVLPALFLIVLAVGATGCRSRQEQESVTPTVAGTPTLVPTATVDPNQTPTARTLVVGTAADYPPFAFYTNDFQLDGFDVALIREIGRRLGYGVELRDMAFDGLGGALQVDQIDAAIAAISVTDERRQFVDFSNVYFVSEDAVLARADADVTINGVEDMAPYRIGVQAGSVFQEWLTRELVDTGRMPATNLFIYTETDSAIEDLADGRIDLIVADLPPLEVAQQGGLLKIVARGLNRQLFAIALPKGSPLTPEINDVLIQMQNEGVLADLSERYLGLEPEDVAPLPTPEPEPTAAPTAAPPPAGCIDAMAFVADLNLDDRNMTAPPVVNPGQPFQKGWRIRNTGTCTWGPGYLLTYVDGNVPGARMGGVPTPIQGTVPPGAEYDIYVDLVAPLAPGVYQAFWTMRNPNGLLFGDRIWVGITVPAPPTPTPLPTATPAPTIDFRVDRTNITAGECVTFFWSVTNALNVYFYAQGEPWHLNQVPPQGRQVECPPVTTTYDLRVVRPDNTLDIRSIRIDVTQPPVNAPVIVLFTVTPDFQILVGQCVDVRWQVEGQVNNIRVARNDVTLWDSAPLGGTSRDCPPVGQAVYTIEAVGPGGTARAQQNVSVLPQPTPPPQATPTPPLPTPTAQPPIQQPPVINSFAVVPGEIQAGQCVTASWSVGGNVNLVRLLRDGVIVIDFAQFAGSATDCLNNPGTYTYRVEATNSLGEMAFQQATVIVGSPPPSESIVGSWRLISLNGQPILPGTELTAIFGDAANLSGSAGCNSFNGNYNVDGANLSIGPVGSGQQICVTPEGIMQQETAYLDALRGASSFFVTGRQLTINGSATLVFETLAQPR